MKIVVKAFAPVADADVKRNEAYAKGLGFPRLGKAETPRLAVVGGGPSIKERVDELRAFDGDIWAINGAWKWCEDQGIDAWFYSLDPQDLIIPMCVGARKAMLGMCCHYGVFDLLHDAHVEAVLIGGEGMDNGPTSASSAPFIALERGYTEIHFFGCESSYADTTHAYGNFNLENLMRVKCAGEEFLTSSDFLYQAEQLGAVIREFPKFFKDASGGLLSAVIKEPQIVTLAATQQVHDALVFDAAHDMGVEELMSAEYRAALDHA